MKQLLSVLGLLAAVVVIGVLAIGRPAPSLPIKAGPSLEPMVYFEPAGLTAAVGQPVTVTLKANTGEQVVGGLAGSLRFDPALLRLDRSAPGSFFAALELSNTGSRIDLQAAERVSGGGTIARLVFIPRQTGKTEIAFEPGFALTDTGRTNLLTGPLRPATVTISIK